MVGKKQEVIIFGGAFDPIHLMHLKVAQTALKNGPYNGVWFMPAYKDTFGLKKLTPAHHRIKMIDLALLPYTNCEVCPLEVLQKHTSGTYKLLKKCEKFMPKYRFTLLIGGDQFKYIDLWKNYKKLKEEFNIIVAPRDRKGISSTFIRSNKSIAKEFLPNKVFNYALENNLYNWRD